MIRSNRRNGAFPALWLALLTPWYLPAEPGEITIHHIAEGIRNHIAEQSEAHEGFFQVAHEGATLNLKLIRVHMEYLANLGDGVQFACVDLVEADGTVYDVDFFLAGTQPGDLEVTETHVHKLDGQPLYAWEQKDDGTWHRVAVDEASEELFGVLREADAFTFTYRFDIPDLEGPARLWIPFARSDENQNVRVKHIQTPVPWEMLTDDKYGNSALYLEPRPEHSGQAVTIAYEVNRREAGPYEAHPTENPSLFLQPESMVPLNETFKEIAERVLAGTTATSNLMRARELYNHTIETMRYARYGDGWGVGDAVYACDVKSGNCSDFHSYFIAVARAAGIPARFMIGAAIPSERDEGGVDGYHCWAEFFADGRWWPVDISEANKHRKLADYYFGKHPANRFELSRGRDLVFTPAPGGKPMNFLVYPILETGGTVSTHRPVFEFQRLASGAGGAETTLAQADDRKPQPQGG